MMKGFNVFLSYQRSDTLFAAHALGYALRLAGNEAFVDTGSIGGGELYPQKISKAISRANVVLALIGPKFEVKNLHEPTSVVAFEWRYAQYHGSAVVPVLIENAAMPKENDLPRELRWIVKRNAYALRPSSLEPDIDAVVKDIPVMAVEPRRVARVLWVDDKPANNEFERAKLRPFGIVFDSVVSTHEAVAQLALESYDLVITDLGRQNSSDRSATAGTAFLEHPSVKKVGPPVIVYAGTWAVAQRDELVRLGASDVMASREQLINTVLRMLGRAPEEPARDLIR
jgi:CheY-like chemotaxis protein